MSGIPLGRFSWYELLTTDPEGAMAFYGRIAGWTAMPWEGSGVPYTVLMNGETGIGGVMQLPQEARDAGAPSHWVAYISTPDAADTLRRAEELGGSLLWGPRDVPEVGTVAMLRDPQGAMFAIYQPAGDAPGHDGPAEVGEFSWHELATTDWEGAWAFYSELFGWQKADDMDMGEAGTYRMFHNGAQPLGGIYNKPPEIPVARWLLYVRVPDADEAARLTGELGGTIVNGPMEVPGGDRVAQGFDPQGAGFAVHSVAGS